MLKENSLFQERRKKNLFNQSSTSTRYKYFICQGIKMFQQKLHIIIPQFVRMYEGGGYTQEEYYYISELTIKIINKL